MEIKNIDDLMTQLGNFLNTYYYYAVAAGVIITIIIVVIALKIRLKIINKGKGKSDSSSDAGSMIMSLLIGSNPEILNQMVDEKAKHKEKIIEEIKRFSKIKDFKKINDSTAEITVEIDGEEHWYRAKTTADGHKPKILSLSKIK
ncbi:MAG: hypothetical protein NTZ25_05895 [Candidatus Peregrinibacteria bacterium]|nr:hypothetical protein [Candidatus Peregrinibacteria bacterium]